VCLSHESLKILFNNCFVFLEDDLLDLHPPEGAPVFCGSFLKSGGNFQIAHRNLWFHIRGFEETKNKRNFMDTETQLKVIMAGGP
jgi:hypothetical protein